MPANVLQITFTSSIMLRIWFEGYLKSFVATGIVSSVLHEGFMNTQFALLARYGSPTIELKVVCKEFFGITPKTAEQRAKACDFPIPTFKLRDSERSPSFVKVEDLAAYIDERYRSAKFDWESVNRSAA
nr:pyocin activator PrtN family protein [Vibrio cholerae]